MYYVTYSEYYPIFEPAEGGYYYSGKQVIETRKFTTFRKAKLFIRKWYKDCKNDPYFWTTDDHLTFGQRGKYIGEGYICELTREPVQSKGRCPYC